MTNQAAQRSIILKLSKTELPAFFFGEPGGPVRWLFMTGIHDGVLSLTRHAVPSEAHPALSWSSFPISLQTGEVKELWPDVPSSVSLVSKDGRKARVRFEVPEHVRVELFSAEIGQHFTLKRAVPSFMCEAGWTEAQIYPFRLPPCGATA